MKVKDYVRNKYGIAKVIDIENNNGIDILVFDKPICFLVNKETGEIKDDRLLNRLAIIDGVDVSKIKSSPNIIDLIEEGDHVNGVRVEKNKYGELYTSYVYYGGDIGKQREVYTTWLKEYTEDMIENILTKEQFERTEYKIND